MEAIEPRIFLTTYYVSPSGNDSASGTSIAAPFRTIAKINTLNLDPGDQVLFEGGKTFAGNLTFDATDSGAAASPVIIGSYGSGRATIDGGSAAGLVATNAAGFVVRDLKFTGAWNAATGTGPVNGNGVRFINTAASGSKLSFLRIDNVEVSGFRSTGIFVTCGSGKIGYDDVRITNCVSHDNGSGGITVDGEFIASSTAYAHSNVYIGWCKVYDNFGLPAATSHSGNGIIIADVDGGTIERSLAWNNGALCNSTAGGPVGIWAWDANNITIQHNESWDNKTGATSKDGGGFDLDGGVTNSVMQYNYSHNNHGAGYLLYQFTGARPFGNNIVRYNISQNDGRAHAYGGIYIGGGTTVKNNQIYNNTIYISPATESNIAAIKIDGVGSGNVFRNNNLYTTGGVRLVDNNAASATSSVIFQGNNYFSGGGAFVIRWGASSYSSLTNWRSATGQEILSGSPVGLSINPQLVNAGGGGTIGDASLLHTLSDYQLLGTSPLINAGLSVASTGRDYNANAAPTGAVDIGAFESTPTYTATTGNDSITLRQLSAGGAELMVNSTSPTLTWAAGVFPSYTISGNTGDDTLTLTGGSAFGINAARFISIEQMNLDTGSYTLASPLSLRALDVAASATLDLATHDVTATDGPIGEWNGTAYTGLTGAIAAGRITAAGGVGIAPLSGNVVTRVARPGDANLDGRINGDDYFAIDTGHAARARGYANGDFNYDGRIDADDYFLIDTNHAQPATTYSTVRILPPEDQSAPKLAPTVTFAQLDQEGENSESLAGLL